MLASTTHQLSYSPSPRVYLKSLKCFILKEYLDYNLCNILECLKVCSMLLNLYVHLYIRERVASVIHTWELKLRDFSMTEQRNVAFVW